MKKGVTIGTLSELWYHPGNVRTPECQLVGSLWRPKTRSTNPIQMAREKGTNGGSQSCWRTSNARTSRYQEEEAVGFTPTEAASEETAIHCMSRGCKTTGEAMQREGVIQPSKSPWASPVVLVQWC